MKLNPERHKKGRYTRYSQLGSVSEVFKILIRKHIRMFGKIQLVLVLVTLTGQAPTGKATTVKRDIVGLDAVHLGNFGLISKLPVHPTFAHLGLTPQQAVGFIDILLSNGFLHPYSLRLGNGQPYLMSHHPELFGPHAPFNGNLFFPSLHPIDPYFLLLFSNYAKYLPFGIGSQGFYGSTGLPKVRPLGVFKYSDKN